jgi:hypothetical protein
MNLEIARLITGDLLLRLLINLVAMFLLVRAIYLPLYKKTDFLFTFFLFNLVIFVITHMLNKVELSFGAAFGLFAVFTLLRYRTEIVSPKDMTYLFVVIALGLINAVSKGTPLELALLNLFMLAFIYSLDSGFLIRNEMVQTIYYKGLQNIRPEEQNQLIEHLRVVTGLQIHKIMIESIDLGKEIVTIKVYYYQK